MKKFVKPLVIAASVAAVAGIGAVSFAAWKGGGETSVNTAENTLAKRDAIGFANNTAIAKVDNLQPWDQGNEGTDSTTITGAVKVANFALPAVTSNKEYKVTVSFVGTEPTLDYNSGLYVLINKTATQDNLTEAPTGDWKKIDGTNSVFNFEAPTSADTADQLHAHVVLVSSKLDDMGQKFTIKFAIAAQTV